MATDQNGNGRRPDPDLAAWKREAQAQEVEDKLAWLIDTAKPEKPEEPRPTERSKNERESELALDDVESDVAYDAAYSGHLSPPQLGGIFKWMAVPGLFALIALFIAVLAFGMMRRDTPSATQAPPADQPAASDGRLWYFTNTEGLGLYTIALKGDGTSGATDVIEDTTDTGSYAWQGDTLTINFTRKLTMDDGHVVTDPWTFECTGTQQSTQMNCEVTQQQWSYSGRDGFVVEGERSWPAIAVPR